MKLFIIYIVIVLLAVITFIIWGRSAVVHEQQDFVNREINGAIISLEDIHRGRQSIRIKNGSDSLLTYDLQITRFVKENGIHVGDSICKTANSEITLFYKKQKNGYKYCCELEYRANR